MDPIQTIAFILMVLSYLTNVISGASLGNVELFNETFDAEEQHRTLLQNIQKNYGDEFSNYEMADIENFLSGFITPVKKKTPIYTSKTFFGSDQFFGTKERSKSNSHPQTWDPFRANRVIGSQPSYFDIPDDLFQEYIYSKNNHEAPYFNAGDNSSEFTRGIEDLLENKDKIPFSDITVTNKENNFSRSKDEASEDQDLSRPVDYYSEDELDELLRPEDDYAEDELNELSHRVDDYAEDELDELSRRVDDYAEDELDELSHPVDYNAEDRDELSHPVDYNAEDRDELSHPVDYNAEDRDELSHPVDDDAEDQDELSHPVDDDAEDQDELSHPVDDDAEDQDELSQPVGDDAEDQDELSQPVGDDAEDQDELSQPVGDDAEDQDELSQPVGDDAEDQDELSQPVGDDAEDQDELSQPVGDDAEDQDELSQPVGDDAEDQDELSQPVGDDAEDQDELSQPVGDDAEDQDELSQPVGDDAEDQDELSHPVDELDELSHPLDYDAEDRDELSHPVDYDAEDRDELSHPVGDDAEDRDELSHPVGDDAEDQDELSHPVDDDAEDELDELSHLVDDEAEDELDELSQLLDYDAEDRDELSHPVDYDAEDRDELSHPVSDDAEDQDELSHPVGDDAEDQDELSHPVDYNAEDRDELSHPVDYNAEDRDELSHPVDYNAEDRDELSHPVDYNAEDRDELLHPVDYDAEDRDELLHPVDYDAEDQDELSHPVVDYDAGDRDELSHPVDDDAGDHDELSHPADDYAEDELDKLSHPADDYAEDELDKLSHPADDYAEDELDKLSQSVDYYTDDKLDELSNPVDDGKDEVDELFETVNDTEVQVDEFSHPLNDVAEDELDRPTHPVGVSQGKANEFTHPINENKGQLDELIHLTDKPRSQVEDIFPPVDKSKVHENELSTFQKGVGDSKDIHRGEVLTEKVMFSSLSHSSTAGLDIELLNESSLNPTSREDMSFQTLEDASESREDVDSEVFRVDKLSPTKVSEDLRHLKMTNTTPSFENPRNDNILPTEGQNENESHFSKILDEHLKVQSVGDSDLMGSVATEDLNIHKIDIDEFQGSGDMDDSFDSTLTDSLLESKSGRIIDIFPRVNNTVECTTPKGERGRCLSLTQCPLSDPLNNFNLFLQYVCLSRGVLVGICCPDNPVVEISDPTENSTGTPVTELKQPIDGCGLNTNTRIVGGKVSFPHEWTWMVALLRRNRFFCGGVIINDWYILTAAHCVMGIKVKDLKVRLGEYNFNEKNEHQEDIPVTEIKRHALFVTLTFQHDIALLKLKRRIEYTKFIGSICLPNPKSGNFTNVNATVVGWGTEAFGGSASPVLRQVTVPVWDNDECDKTYRLERITNAFMCAGSPENGEDACQGDSGGPLMALNEEGRWEVIGIVSWGRRCGDPTFPGVYTRVTSYLDWITENAN